MRLPEDGHQTGAPSVILPGNGPEIVRPAEMLCSQKGAVPLFIQHQ
jgi:hypothetical protein